jgi:hypothetical protein
MTAFGSPTSGGTGSGSIGVLGFPGGVNLCLAVHGGDPPCDPTGSPLSIGTSTLIYKAKNVIFYNFKTMYSVKTTYRSAWIRHDYKYYF